MAGLLTVALVPWKVQLRLRLATLPGGLHAHITIHLFFFRGVRLSQGGFIPNNKACPSGRAVKPDLKIFKRARWRIKFFTVR